MIAPFGLWDLVLRNVVQFAILGLFLLSIPFKKRVEFRSYGVYLAFIIALFTEMYGFPLTIYVVSWILGYQIPFMDHLIEGIVGSTFFFRYLYPILQLLMITSIILIVIGWWQIYRSQGELVSNGLYRLSRHPQYFGILLLTLSMAITWMNILNLLMWPILLVLYYRLAKEEENIMEDKFGEEYCEYKRNVSMIIPFLRF